MTISENAADFVLGALSPLEREAVQLERAVNRELDQAITALEEKLAPLAASAGTERPPAYLFDAIVERIAREQSDLRGKVILPLADGDWQQCLPGVEIKRLWSDQAFLMRCEPGAVIPEHMHHAIENMVIIMGDLDVGGRILTSGDYHMSPASSAHCATSTRHGCVILVQYCA